MVIIDARMILNDIRKRSFTVKVRNQLKQTEKIYFEFSKNRCVTCDTWYVHPSGYEHVRPLDVLFHYTMCACFKL
jgi:hypothetical protein